MDGARLKVKVLGDKPNKPLMIVQAGCSYGVFIALEYSLLIAIA
jgi:hypothetical protein